VFRALLGHVTKTPSKSLVDWIAQVLSSAPDEPPATAARGVGERLDPVRRPRGGKRRKEPPDSSKDVPLRQEC
jgi:hypothetical protein